MFAKASIVHGHQSSRVRWGWPTDKGRHTKPLQDILFVTFRRDPNRFSARTALTGDHVREMNAGIYPGFGLRRSAVLAADMAVVPAPAPGFHGPGLLEIGSVAQAHGDELGGVVEGWISDRLVEHETALLA